MKFMGWRVWVRSEEAVCLSKIAQLSNIPTSLLMPMNSKELEKTKRIKMFQVLERQFISFATKALRSSYRHKRTFQEIARVSNLSIYTFLDPWDYFYIRLLFQRLHLIVICLQVQRISVVENMNGVSCLRTWKSSWGHRHVYMYQCSTIHGIWELVRGSYRYIYPIGFDIQYVFICPAIAVLVWKFCKAM